MQEFDGLVAVLRENGVHVIVWQDEPSPVKPDAVFPNNWVSFHSTGAVITYPMYSPLRRLERNESWIQGLETDFQINERIHLEMTEADEIFLEGTGSMVLDRTNKLVYACISPRTDAAMISEWCLRMGYTAVTFYAHYAGAEIYHTNVMMALGEKIAVVCLDVVAEEGRAHLIQQLISTGHEIVRLTEAQVGSFAGNMLALENDEGDSLMVMSATAKNSLTPEQIYQIEKHSRIIVAQVDTIESVGGGSVRCMIAENFLPRI